jgi:diguanylate cyclase (GGDEF)-like protein
MLIVLLIGMMTLSFKAAHDVMLKGAEERLRHAALRKGHNVLAERQDLLRYAGIIANDQRLQEYLHIVLEPGTSHESPMLYVDRQFGLLPNDACLIISDQGEVLLGEGHTRVAEEVLRYLKSAESGYFYFKSPQGVVMVVMAPVIYEGQRLATTVVARTLDQQWLSQQEGSSSDYLLLFEKAGNILWSSNALYQGMGINVHAGVLKEKDQYIHLRKVTLGEANPEVPRLWIGISESVLIHLLASYQRWVYSFTAMGVLAVLLVGWLMVRNISRPFSQLMNITEEMVQGKLPVMSRSESKTEMDQLANRFADVLDALRREQARVRRAHKKLQETAITDSLTGLYNRRYLQEIIAGLFAQVVRDRRYLTAILLDLDYFKAINDCHGHLGGDAVLVHFARLLEHNSRANDYLFRIGGEEFLILNVAEDTDACFALASKIRELVDQSPANYQGSEIPITVSIGISCCLGTSGEGSLSQLMRAADKALYEAKSNGRNQVVRHSSCLDANASSRRRHQLTLVSSRSSEKSEN